MMYFLWCVGTFALTALILGILLLLFHFTAFFFNEKMRNNTDSSEGFFAAGVVWLILTSLLNPLMYMVG